MGSLLGSDPGDAAWSLAGNSAADSPEAAGFPWVTCQSKQSVQRGVMLQLFHGESRQKYMVNATPIVDENGGYRGVLASFDDVTALENKRIELSQMLKTLQSSRDEIRRQNAQLHFLAARDPLTGCLNRRSFLEKLEALWQSNGSSGLSNVRLQESATSGSLTV